MTTDFAAGPERNDIMPIKLQTPLNLGAHVSIAGGVDRAPARGRDVGCDCIQMFTKSNLQWRSKQLSQAEIDNFKSELFAAFKKEIMSVEEI